MIPATTALFAALLGLLGAALTVNVIVNRAGNRVDSGDGGIPALAQAIRAQGNFVEQAPLMLILLGAAEAVGARPVVIAILGVMLLVARLASAWALNRSLGQSPLRQFSGGLSILLLVAGSVATLLALGGIK
jgi:uncharacterized membrane protein YecN with MAPEG domain